MNRDSYDSKIDGGVGGSGTHGAGSNEDRKAMIQRRKDMERRKREERNKGFTIQPTIKSDPKPTPTLKLFSAPKMMGSTTWDEEKRIEDDVPECKEEEDSNSLEPVRPVIREVVSPLHPTEQYLNKSGVKGSYDPTANDDIPTEVLDTPSKYNKPNNNNNNSNSINSYSNDITTGRERKEDNSSSRGDNEYNHRNNPNRTAMRGKDYNYNDKPIAGSPHVHLNRDDRDMDMDSNSPGPDDDNDDEYYPSSGYKYSDEDEDDYTPPGDADYVRPSGGDSEEKYDESEPIIFTDSESKKCFLTKPCPIKYGVVQCYIERTKQGFRGNSCQYDVYLRDGNQYILSGKKKSHSKTSNYYIASDRAGLDQVGPTFLGKLRANFVGTEFTIYGPGKNPKDLDADTLSTTTSLVRDERGVIMYASNLLGARGPRKMTVIFPKVKDETTVTEWRPIKKKDGILAKYQRQEIADLDFLHNKSPRWNEQVGAYVLNFNGRVTMASVKNFQLIRPDDENNVILQFGRVGKDQFTMDFQYPLSAFQAFAICLSSFDNKILCE